MQYGDTVKLINGDIGIVLDPEPYIPPECGGEAFMGYKVLIDNEVYIVPAHAIEVVPHLDQRAEGCIVSIVGTIILAALIVLAQMVGLL